MYIPAPIILIDDDEDDHYFFRAFCEKAGICAELKVFYDGASALQYLKATNIKTFIIFCDINMPVMDGLELRRRINDDSRLREQCIPFIFYSTAASPAQVREAFELSAQGFFIKDANIAATEHTLQCILEYWLVCKHPNAL